MSEFVGIRFLLVYISPMAARQEMPPVLLIGFNRPEYTREVWEALRRIKPPRLYVAVDGPRPGNATDRQRCREVRKIVSQADWPCNLQTRFRKTNLGCKTGPVDAINWFFREEEAGIILEDDCVPTPDFFRFCAELLERYGEDERVMMISGSSFAGPDVPVESSYFFVNFYNIWGWATWRRAWRHYDPALTAWKDLRNSLDLEYQLPDARLARFYRTMFTMIEDGLDAWDVQWWFCCIFQHGLAVVPRVNLICNVGLEGTHQATQGATGIRMETGRLYPGRLKHPNHVCAAALPSSLSWRNGHAGIDLTRAAPEISLARLIARGARILVPGFVRRAFRRRRKGGG